MKSYKIKKGNHYCNVSLLERIRSFRFKTVRTIHIRFQFDWNCWYEYVNNDSHDINKLGGIVFGYDPHKSSMRIGWCPNFTIKGKIKLFAYVYDNGIRTIQLLDIVDVDKIYFVRITKYTFYEFLIKEENEDWGPIGKVIRIPNNDDKDKPSFHLYPYFGGNNKAPHDITINMELD